MTKTDPKTPTYSKFFCVFTKAPWRAVTDEIHDSCCCLNEAQNIQIRQKMLERVKLEAIKTTLSADRKM